MNKRDAAFDWAYEIYLSQAVRLRRAVLAIIGLFLLLVLSLLVILVLLPLKENIPYLYAFDKASGEITKIGTLERTTLSENWALTRYLLIHYVTNREEYNADNIDVPYQMTWAQSGENVRKQYEQEVNSSNKKSPYRLYGKDKYVTVQVISINQLNDNTVDLKFQKDLHDRASGSVLVSQKEAIVKWEYSDAETTQKMLDRDPLGFRISYYKTSTVNLENSH